LVNSKLHLYEIIAEMNTSAHAKEQDDNKPLWNYVTILRVLGSGNFEIKDNMCEVNFNGSYTLE